MSEKHHRHHLRHLFRKDSSDAESVSSSHLNLSKFFHKEKSPKESRAGTPDAEKPRLARLNTQPKPQERAGENLDRERAHAEAPANAAEKVPADAQGEHHESPNKEYSDTESVHSRASTHSPITTLKRHDSNLKFSRANSVRQPPRRAESLTHFDSRKKPLPPSTANCKRLSNHVGHHEKIVYNPYGINKSVSNQAQHSAQYYLTGGPESSNRVVANPVANPNDYLPDDLHEEHINLLEDFEWETHEKKVGDGGSGDVRIVCLATNKKRHFALKKFILFPKESDEEFYKRAAKEYIISRKLSKSRHVVNTIALLRIQSNLNMSRGWGMIMDYCAGGDLFNMIVKSGWRRTHLNERFCIFKQIAYGLKFMHENDIVHRDLKPENVLLDANGLIKLCDFGVSDYGHEEWGNWDSPVKLSTAYVGSPPYSPPEVMTLKELSSSEIKSHAYDPFKMDCWGLGMLLFCLVYAGVPFQQATPSDHQYRDYKFNRDRFASDHPSFKSNTEFAKGPGSEFKLAAQFQSTGAARVAWKLCDPSPKSRYNLDVLFQDPWFVGLEMCVYEHSDQQVDPFIDMSGSSSHQSSRAPSRKNTVSSFNYHDDSDSVPQTPIRSMLGPGPGSDANDDTSSIKSNSSLNFTPLKVSHDKPQRNNSEFSLHSTSSSGSVNKVRSMLDVSDKAPLPKVAESEKEEKPGPPSLEVLPEVNTNYDEEAQNQSSSSCSSSAGVTPVPESRDDKDSVQNSPRPKDSSKAEKLGPSASEIWEEEPLHPSQDCKLNADGTCELGYRLRKHHHLDISNTAGGPKPRR